MSETEQERVIRVRAAERAHDDYYKGTLTLFDSIMTFSIAAMRTPGLAAAGGIAATLGFYSANYARLRAVPEALLEFNAVLFWMFLSLLATICAPGLAYFSQSFFLWGEGAKKLSWEWPYVGTNRRSKILIRVGIGFQVATVLCVLASIVLMIVGGVRFLHLVAVLPT
ncbi:hypothetical protein [Oricola sp.]|uniref:hypothetical protein n=1 Tax=Oricola sp. TaxID=1979950 RepID=UPI0025D5E437|nr:hypothetical protein [Oricola sp.]MCI5078246.1 hypothetical protein [Oricola sp.]